MPSHPEEIPAQRDFEPLVPVVFSNEGLIAGLEPGSVPYSVFDLVTAEFDVRNSPDNPANEIRRLAADRRRFNRVRLELEQHALELRPETKLLRVRDHEGKPDKPWPSHGMRGRPDFPRARANVDGQSILYCADSLETALAEVRGGPGTYFTVASLQPGRRLKLVSVVGKRGNGAANPFALVDLWMSRPVYDRNRVLRPHPAVNQQEHYYATQLFSCIVRERGYDGVQFSSSVREGGTNFALFDPYCVDVIDTRLMQT